LWKAYPQRRAPVDRYTRFQGYPQGLFEAKKCWGFKEISSDIEALTDRLILYPLKFSLDENWLNFL
jgi:hypothetical protein